MRVALCDDDELQFAAAEQALQAFADTRDMTLQVERFLDVASCVVAADGFDIVFMDVEFPDGPSGIGGAARINQIAPNCRVVYLTNHLQYSLDVYRTDHAWYVLKDQFAQRLPEIFDKFERVDAVRREFLVVTTKGSRNLVSIPCAKILYLERTGRVTNIITRDEVYTTRDKLPDLLAKLPQLAFARCHNSYAVNLEHVREVHAGDLLLDGGVRVLVSRSYSRKFRERFLLWADSWTL